MIAVVTGIFSTISVVLNSKYPALAVALFVAALISIYIFINKRAKGAKDVVANPLKHPVFYAIDYNLTTGIYNFPIDNQKKKKLVTCYVREKLEIIRDILHETIKDDALDEMPKKLLGVNSQIQDNMRNISPKIFMDKINEWDNKHNSWTMNTINNIIDSNYYISKEAKMASCLDCVLAMVRSTIVTVENTINQLNGELEAYIDRGKDE